MSLGGVLYVNAIYVVLVTLNEKSAVSLQKERQRRYFVDIV